MFSGGKSGLLKVANGKSQAIKLAKLVVYQYGSPISKDTPRTQQQQQQQQQ